VTKVTNPRGNETNHGFDALDRLVTSVAADGGSATNAYDDRDDVSAFTDGASVQTSFTRNGFGEVVREVSPDRGTTNYTYDLAGDVIRVVDARGQRLDYIRDILGRVTRKRPVGQLSTENIDFTYDTPAVSNSYGVGRLSRVDDASGITRFAYDWRGNLVTRFQRLPGIVDWVVTRFLYDRANRIERITYPSGRLVQYLRDTKGRVLSVKTKASAKVTAWTNVATGLQYEAFGSLKQANLGNGLRMLNDWGNDGRLASRGPC
jgi:YD repeat-containing protein